jgi:hypothetical protein
MLQLRLWTHRADAIYFCIYPNLMKVFSSNSLWLDQSVAALDTSRDIQPGCVGCVNCQCTNHKGIEATSSERRKHFLNSFYNEVKSFLIMSFATSQNQFLTQLKCIDLGHLVLRTTSRSWYLISYYEKVCIPTRCISWDRVEVSYFEEDGRWKADNYYRDDHHIQYSYLLCGLWNI